MILCALYGELMSICLTAAYDRSKIEIAVDQIRNGVGIENFQNHRVKKLLQEVNIFFLLLFAQ